MDWVDREAQIEFTLRHDTADQMGRKLVNKRKTALIVLLVVTVIWGATFVWMKQALGTAEQHLGPNAAKTTSGLFLAMRFGLAALLLPVFAPKARQFRSFSPRLIRDASIYGLLLVAGFLIQMIALDEITPAVSAFLTSLYVIFTAFISLFFARHRHISKYLVFGVLFATAGAAFISGPPQLNFNTAEWLTVLCALLFAMSIMATDYTTRTYEPDHVSMVSFAAVALGGAAFLTSTLVGNPDAPSLEVLTGLALDPGFLVPLLCCSLLATLFALTLLNHYQRYISPVRAATLYSLEPVWGAALSLAIGTETANPWLFGGAAALLAGNIVAELGSKPQSPD